MEESIILDLVNKELQRLHDSLDIPQLTQDDRMQILKLISKINNEYFLSKVIIESKPIVNFGGICETNI